MKTGEINFFKEDEPIRYQSSNERTIISKRLLSVKQKEMEKGLEHVINSENWY